VAVAHTRDKPCQSLRLYLTEIKSAPALETACSRCLSRAVKLSSPRRACGKISENQIPRPISADRSKLLPSQPAFPPDPIAMRFGTGSVLLLPRRMIRTARRPQPDRRAVQALPSVCLACGGVMPASIAEPALPEGAD